MLTPPAPSVEEPEPRSERPGERGSIVTSVLVMLILGALTAAAMSLSQSTLRLTGRLSDQDQAMAAADIAIAEATARLQIGERTAFSGTGATVDARYRFVATRHSVVNWTVYGEGTSGTVTTAVQATLTGRYTGANPYALVATAQLSLAANTTGVTEPYASNGPVAVSGSTANLHAHLFAPRGSCANCLSSERFGAPWRAAQPSTPTNGRACPLATLTESSGRRSTVYGFLGTVDGRNGIPFRCTFDDRNVVFGHRPAIVYETITVRNPPLVIHVDDRVTLWFLRADVNPRGRAVDVRIEAVGGPTTNNGYQYGQLWDDGMGVRGVVHAPARTLEANSVAVNGLLTIGTLRSTNPSAVQVQGDPSVVDPQISWTMSNWQRVDPRS